MSTEPTSTREARGRVLLAAAAAALIAALALAPHAAGGTGEPGRPAAGPAEQPPEAADAAAAAAGETEVTEPGEPAEPGDPAVVVETARREIRVPKVHVQAPRIHVRRAGEGAGKATLVYVGEDGEPVRMEIEADGEGGFHWVERDAGGEVVSVRPLDEIAGPGEPRVRAVFIGEEAAPIEVECPAAEGGECPLGFRFGYHYLDPEGMGASRGYLGAALTELSPELRAHFGAPEDAGVLVARVEDDSPAAAAGLAVGDVITAIDGERVTDSFDLRRRVRTMNEGERVGLEVVRGGRVLALQVTVAERELPEVDVRRFLWPGPGAGGEHGEAFLYRLDPEALNEAVVELKERFAAPEIRRDVIRLRGAEGELERRIVELEERIAELEELLEREPAPER